MQAGLRVLAPRQMALPFVMAPQYHAAEFLAGPANAEALAWLAQPAAWPNLRLSVWGEAGTGKTHLLHYFCARSGAALLQGPALQLDEPPPEAPALAVDDADCAPDARSLLHFLNAAAERAVPVLLAARSAPARWDYALPDLMSRLRATTSVRLLAPDDAMLRALLMQLCAQRQLAVPLAAQEYLLARLPRTGGALREAVARLDRLGLAAGRRIDRKSVV